MSRISAKSSKRSRNKNRVGYRPVTTKEVRKAERQALTKITLKTIQQKRVVSMRGRTSYMQEEAPGMTELQLPQDVLLASTAIKKFKYDLKSKTLRIWFVKKGVYDYYDVPEGVVMELARAQSKGHYFYYNIRTEYKYKRIR